MLLLRTVATHPLNKDKKTYFYYQKTPKSTLPNQNKHISSLFLMCMTGTSSFLLLDYFVLPIVHKVKPLKKIGSDVL